jgi:transposase-like protein
MAHYPADIILWGVRRYLRFPISFPHIAEMALERGLLIHSSCIWRWVQIYRPELDQRCRAHLKRTNKSYRVDETYIPIKGQDRYLYRAVDSTGQTIDFLLTAKRDAASAKRFFCKTLLDPANPQPRVINVDKNRAYPAAVEDSRSRAHSGAAVDYAGANVVLQEVFGFVKEKLSEAQQRKRAGARKGAWGSSVPTSAHSRPEGDQRSG